MFKVSSSPQIMGILNITPDSFSDGGKFFKNPEEAALAALKMEKEGASIIDVGGESTRPFAAPISVDEELERVIPVIEKIRQQSSIRISIDTSQPLVMHQAIKAGANFINDVRALRKKGASKMAAKLQVPVCIMHMQKNPQTMQLSPFYKAVVDEVLEFLTQRIKFALRAGIKKENIIVDPGFGFGKTLEQNLCLLKSISKFIDLGYPVLVGLSRKSMIGEILNAPTNERLSGSLALAAYAALNRVSIIRCHDVKETYDVIRIISALNAS